MAIKVLVTVVVYDRLTNLKRWLDCWEVCDNPPGTGLAVVHNYDQEEDCIPYRDLCAQNNVHYVPRKNVGMDIGAFQDICKQRLAGFPNDWEYLLLVADDTIPMSKKFVSRFLEEVTKPKVGVACLEISPERKLHIRTSGFILSKAVSLKLRFPIDPIIDKLHCYMFEHGSPNAFYEQIIKLGLKIVQVSQSLTESLLWDTGHRVRLNRWDEFNKEFTRILTT